MVEVISSTKGADKHFPVSTPVELEEAVRSSLVPRPKEVEKKKGAGFSRLRMCVVISYLSSCMCVCVLGGSGVGWAGKW